MKEKRECKIVQDLLPSYVEGLTDIQTNEYVEEHIQECEECKEKLKEMNGELKLDKIEQEAEIKYLEKVRIRTRNIVIIVSIIIIIAMLGGFRVYQNIIGNYLIAAEGNHERTNEASKIVNAMTYLDVIYDIERKGNTVKAECIVSFKEDKVIDVRIKESGYLLEEIQKQYEGLKQFNTNVRLEGNTISYNTYRYNGLTKKEFVEKWEGYYQNIEAKEL